MWDFCCGYSLNTLMCQCCYVWECCLLWNAALSCGGGNRIVSGCVYMDCRFVYGKYGSANSHIGGNRMSVCNASTINCRIPSRALIGKWVAKAVLNVSNFIRCNSRYGHIQVPLGTSGWPVGASWARRSNPIVLSRLLLQGVVWEIHCFC